MKAVIQRVKRASVEIDRQISGQCGKGLMILLGVADGDTENDAERGQHRPDLVQHQVVERKGDLIAEFHCFTSNSVILPFLTSISLPT